MQEVLVSKIFNYTSTPTKNVEGQFWFNPSTNVLSRFNGTVWKPITVSSDDVAVLTDGSTVSLTSYLNTQIAALAEGIDSKQDKLLYYSETSGDAPSAIISVTNIKLKGSVAEGIGTTASGQYSHAEGHLTTAAGVYSHAEGANTTASSSYQHAQGKYNIEDADNKYADIIGNGSSVSARSNAATVSWDGITWSQSDVRAGGTDQDNATYSLSALAEGIDSKQDKLETYKEKQGPYNNNIIITSTNSNDTTGDITLTTDGGSISSPGSIKLQCGSGSTGGSIDLISGSGSSAGDINLECGTSASEIGGGNINLKAADVASGTSGKAGNINISGGQSSNGTGDGGSINISGGTGNGTDGATGGSINITAGSATGENSASGRIKLNVPDKSGIVIDKDLIALNYKGNTNVPPSSNEWKFYIGGSGGINAGGDFSNSKTSNLYLGYGDYSTNINLGGSNSNATINICSAGGSNSNTINIGTAKTTNYINIGPSDSQSVYSTLTLNCEILSGKTFNTELTSTSDNNHIPTSKAVYDALTLKQNTLQFYTESITDVPGYPPGSGIYQEQISLGKNNYNQTINIGGSNGFQIINLGGSAASSGRITIGTTGIGSNQIQIGHDNTGTALEINAFTVNGTAIDKTELTESSNKLPTSQAVLNGLSAKQNTTDNNLTTTDKTIVGAINELKTATDSMVVVSTDNAINIAPTTAQTGILIASSKTNGGNVIITPKITNTGACYLSTSSTYSNLNPIYPDPTNNKYTYPNLGTVYLFVDNAGDSADIVIENFAG